MGGRGQGEEWGIRGGARGGRGRRDKGRDG